MPGPESELARSGLALLRSMRGAAGKLAQLADFADPTWAPEEKRAKLERELASLRAGFPEPLAGKRVERLLRDAWGTRVAEHLAELDPEPAAIASAGQVHRGELAAEAPSRSRSCTRAPRRRCARTSSTSRCSRSWP